MENNKQGKSKSINMSGWSIVTGMDWSMSPVYPSGLHEILRINSELGKGTGKIKR